MALLGSTFVTDEVEDLSYQPLPADLYTLQITKSELKPTKSADGEYLKLELTVLEGEFSGRKVYELLNLVNKNEKAVAIARSKLKELCKAMGISEFEDTNELHGIPFKANIVIEASKDPAYSDQNRLKKCFSLDDSSSAEDAPW